MAIRNVRTGVNIADADAAVDEVAAPKTFYSVAPPKKTGTMPNVALDPALNAYPAGYHAGAASLTAVDADLATSEIKDGVTIFGVLGTYAPGGHYEREFPLVIPIPTITLSVVEDHSGGGFTTEIPLAVPVPSISLATAASSPLAVDGAVADDGGAQTDETAAANNATANDMTLLPAVPEINDAYYFGLASQWDWLLLNIGTQGAGVWTLVWEYYNGATWAALTIKYDEISNFRAASGNRRLHFNRPGDWAIATVGGIANLYWIRGRVSAYASITTQPLGTQAWIGQY